MNYLLNQSVQSIEISGIRKFFNLVANESDVVSLTMGQPDFQTPEHVKNAAANALKANYTTYTHNAGILELRKAIARFNEEQYNISYHPEKEIIVTAGASQAIDIAFRTILNPGDEVILPGPIYPGYEPLIHLANAKAVYADTRHTDFKITVHTLKEIVTEKTKCIVLPYPSNPTGASFTQEELKELVAYLKDLNIFILADEIYSTLSYDFDHCSIASFNEMKERVLVINGLSKSHSMTGFRVGYIMAPEWVTEQMIKVHQYNISCASSISQHAALEAIENGLSGANKMKESFHKRRDYVYDRLSDMGLELNRPNGAFYCFPQFPAKEMNSFDLGLDLVKRSKVALVPGSSFPVLGEGYMRISYAYDMKQLKEGLNRIETYLEAHETL